MWGFARVDFNREAGNDANNEGNAAGADVRERYLEWHRNFVELDSPRQVNNGTDVTSAFRDVNACGSQGKTVLMYACENGCVNEVKTLLVAGADVNAKDSEGKTALMYACKNGRMEVVKTLIEASGDVNACDSQGKTALMYVRGYDRVEVVKTLIEAGADVNARDSHGATVLMYAIWNGHSNKVKALVVEALIEAGAEVNAKDSEGKTALMQACRNGCLGVVKVLISNGADVNVRDSRNGKTVLMYACEYGLTDIVRDIVQLLLDARADVHAWDNDGHTASWYANQKGYSWINLLLKDRWKNGVLIIRHQSNFPSSTGFGAERRGGVRQKVQRCSVCQSGKADTVKNTAGANVNAAADNEKNKKIPVEILPGRKKKQGKGRFFSNGKLETSGSGSSPRQGSVKTGLHQSAEGRVFQVELKSYGKKTEPSRQSQGPKNKSES